MSSSILIRWSGLAALVGFLLLAVSGPVNFVVLPKDVATSVAATSNAWFITTLLGVCGILFALVGLIGLYARQAEKAGLLGLLAFLLTFLSTGLVYGWIWMEAFVWPVLAQAAPRLLDHPEQYSATPLLVLAILGPLLLLVGWLLFGVVSLRAGVLPRWAAVLVLVGAAVTLVLSFVGTGVPFGNNNTLACLGFAWMGYAVWSRKQTTTESLAPLMAGKPSPASR
jgi:hypothetical protein